MAATACPPNNHTPNPATASRTPRALPSRSPLSLSGSRPSPSRPSLPCRPLLSRLPAWVGTLLLSVCLFGLLTGTQASAATPNVTCSLYVAQNGSDNAVGNATQPFATIQHLADTLTPGQTGCVHAGSYTENVTILNTGQPGAPITITSNPGERATLTGRLWIHQTANYITISNLNLNGRNTQALPSPDINAEHTTFTGNDVTNEHTAICFDIGSDTSYGRATNTIIQGNRIHDCGTLPAANHDHGIYVESATNTTIIENVIYKNADRGIQLYPDAQQTLIEHNIIDANGEDIIFSGDFGVASNNNTIQNNLITNAQLRYDIESWYPESNPTGTGNTVTHNCVWGGTNGTIQTPQTGYTATNNTTTNPQYANPTTGDYRINNTSPCATLLTNTNTPTQPFTTTSTITYVGTEASSGGSSGSGAGTSGGTSTSGTSGSSGGSATGGSSAGGSTTTTKTVHHHHRASTLAVASSRRGHTAKRSGHHRTAHSAYAPRRTRGHHRTHR